MFTGIVQAVGKVIKYDGKRPPHNRRASAQSSGGRLWISAPFRNLRLGESIAVDGVCLTLAARKGRSLAFDLGKETRDITTLGSIIAGCRVNLERALRVGDRVGGHWVSGHVDAAGRLLSVEKARLNTWIKIQLPVKIARFVRNKGSITVDGVSLTITRVQGRNIRIMLIPHTLRHTTLGDKVRGDLLNLEVDLYAKYVLR